MTSEPRQLYLPDGENAGESRRATAQLGDLHDGAGGRVGGGTAQGGRRDTVQRASGGTTARRGTGGVPRTTGVRAAAWAAWGSAGRAWGSAGVHGRGARRVGARGTACRGGRGGVGLDGVGLGGVQGRAGVGSAAARACGGAAVRARGAAAWRVGAGTGGRRAAGSVRWRGEGRAGVGRRRGEATAD
eukprot:XP_020399765.1 spidroin-1-like [Zea mays]